MCPVIDIHLSHGGQCISLNFNACFGSSRKFVLYKSLSYKISLVQFSKKIYIISTN